MFTSAGSQSQVQIGELTVMGVDNGVCRGCQEMQLGVVSADTIMMRAEMITGRVVGKWVY